MLDTKLIQGAFTYVASSFVLYVLRRGNCLEHVRGFACISFYLFFAWSFACIALRLVGLTVEIKQSTINQYELIISLSPKMKKLHARNTSNRSWKRRARGKWAARLSLNSSLYEGAWLAKTVVLTSIKIAENASRSSAATTHCESWTLSSNTEICKSTPGEEIFWVIGHTLICFVQCWMFVWKEVQNCRQIAIWWSATWIWMDIQNLQKPEEPGDSAE